MPKKKSVVGEELIRRLAVQVENFIAGLRASIRKPADWIYQGSLLAGATDDFGSWRTVEAMRICLWAARRNDVTASIARGVELALESEYDLNRVPRGLGMDMGKEMRPFFDENRELVAEILLSCAGGKA